MTVNPGFGGQAFIPAMVEKVRRVRAMVAGRDVEIQVDGGITPDTAPAIAAAGANVLVAGSAVFKGGSVDSYRRNIEAIRRAAGAVRGEFA
jgi:ribulose-phosphate 3-epimerase